MARRFLKTARAVVVVAILMIVTGIPLPVLAQTDDFSIGGENSNFALKTKQENAACLSCHSEAGIKNPPQQGLDIAKLATLGIDTGHFESSVHGDSSCKECHGENVAAYPHTKGPVKGCPECHKGSSSLIEPEFEKSLHHKNNPDTFTCDSCHDAHTIQKTKKLGTLSKIAAQDNDLCLSCHGKDSKYAKFRDPQLRPDMAMVHAWLPRLDLHWKLVRCIDCHTPEVEGAASHDILPKDKSQRHCVACHSMDSSLRVRLSGVLIENEGAKNAGFINAFILNDAYVVGATRNTKLDKLGFILFGLLVSSLALHGVLRIISSAWRKRRKR